MRSGLTLGFLAATLPVHALVLKVDQSKGECEISRAGSGDLAITCPSAAAPSMSPLGAYRVEVLQAGGVPMTRFVVAVPPGQAVAPVAVPGGWSFAGANGNAGSTNGPATVAQAPRPTPAPEPVAQGSPRPAPTIPRPGATSTSQAAAAKTVDAEVEGLAKEAAEKKQDIQFDYSIPDMPAFTVLGMTPENVQQPRTARALALALKNGIDENGKLKTGLALEFQPFRLTNPTQVLRSYLPGGPGYSPRNYGANTIGQMITNSSVSIATAQGSTEADKSMRLGIGLRIPIIDKSDGRTDQAIRSCYENVKASLLKRYPDVGQPAPSDAELDKIEQAAFDEARACLHKPRQSAFWNSTAWIVSLGGAWTSDSGSFDDRKTATRGAWTTYAYGFDGDPVLGNAAQFIFHLRALDRERVPHPTDTGKFLNQDSRAAAIGFKYGVETFNGSLQASAHRVKFEGLPREDKLRKYSLGVEYRLTDSLWLVAAVGGEKGRVNGENKSFVTTSFRYQPKATNKDRSATPP